MTSNEKEAAADFSTFFGGLYPVQKLATTNVSFSENQLKSFHAAGARIPLEQYK